MLVKVALTLGCVFAGVVILVVGGKIVAAIDNLNSNISNLNTHLDTLIGAGVGGASAASETAIQAAADQVAALDQKVLAATPAPGQ